MLTFSFAFHDHITGKTGPFAPNASIIHIDIDPAAISRNIVVDIPIVADAKKAGEALLSKVRHLCIDEWIEKITAWKEAYPLKMNESGLTPQYIIEQINLVFPDAIVVTDL